MLHLQLCQGFLPEVHRSIPLCEGDEVCSLIKDTFEQMKISLSHSPFDIQADGEWNLLKDLRIDFREKRTPFLSA